MKKPFLNFEERKLIKIDCLSSDVLRMRILIFKILRDSKNLITRKLKNFRAGKNTF
jgi:hypothetical protein